MLDQALQEGESVTLDDILIPIIAIVKDSKVERMAKNDFEIRNLDKKFTLVALERPPHDTSDIKKYTAVPLMITQQRSSYMLWKTQQPLTQSRILILPRDATCRQVKKYIFKLFRPVI